MYKRRFGKSIKGRDDKPPDPISIGIGSLIIGGISTVMQYQQSKKAQRAAERSAEEQQRAQQIAANRAAAQSKRERMREIAEKRRLAATQEYAQNFGGSTGGSGYAGASGSLTSQLGSNLAFQRTQQGYSGAISGANISAAGYQGDANRAMSNANMWGAIGGTAWGAFDQSGGFQNLFKA